MSAYKLPFVVSLEYSREAVRQVIKKYAINWSVNELATSYHCQQDGMRFDIVQFHGTRNLAHFMSAE